MASGSTACRLPPRSTSEVAVCCSSASERCPRASASSRVRSSSCFFNSISELGPLLTRAVAFVPDERSLRPRVGLFAPLRDKVTSSAQSLARPFGRPSQGSGLSILTEPHDELAGPHSITSSAAIRGTARYRISGHSRTDHSGLMPADFTTLPHFSVSSAMSLPKSVAEPTSGVLPKSASRALIL
jgi:hypothetical protein